MPEAAEERRNIYRSPLAITATVIAALIVSGSIFILSDDDASDPGEEFCWSLVSSESSEDSGPLTKCGEALESAMTGRRAGEDAPRTTDRHSVEQVRMTERVISAYTESETTVVPEAIRKNLGNALSHYSSDVSDILQVDVDYSDADFATEPNNLSVSVADLSDFIFKLGADSDAFDVVYESQFNIISRQIDALTRRDFTATPTGETDRPLGMMRQFGRATGILHKIAEKESFTDTEKYGFPRLRNALDERVEKEGVNRKDRRLESLYRAAEESFLDWS
ncbi:hypothetical protein G3I38_30665 [Streptomyces sp. SID7958]|uniref:Uncharacterized protein n=2 Tax=unclassified Streptomyces TaxID=2593676 RepID=A0A6G3QYD2_9ACTN|nr:MULTISPECIES: hypothetical protein [unclassified Streptomyces]NEA88200.1 hypothetical protein [Streptomyces sp. SID14436]NEC83488.1 hypothetical protein [Streptomyces sp. SID7958]